MKVFASTTVMATAAPLNSFGVAPLIVTVPPVKPWFAEVARAVVDLMEEVTALLTFTPGAELRVYVKRSVW